LTMDFLPLMGNGERLFSFSLPGVVNWFLAIIRFTSKRFWGTCCSG
jgi:hypothetical protein